MNATLRSVVMWTFRVTWILSLALPIATFALFTTPGADVPDLLFVAVAYGAVAAVGLLGLASLVGVFDAARRWQSVATLVLVVSVVVVGIGGYDLFFGEHGLVIQILDGLAHLH